ALLHDDLYRLALETWEQTSLPNRLSEAAQVEFARRQVERGLPREQLDSLNQLARNHSSLILPIIVSKTEDVLRSGNPADAFAEKTVDPQRFLAAAFAILIETVDEQALRQASRLFKLGNYAGLVT